MTTDFNDYRDSYRDEVDRSIAFSGQGAEYFVRAKAELLVDLVSRRLGSPERTRALDVGCGPGETDSFLAGSFAELHGVDVAEDLVEVARRRNPDASYASYQAGSPLPYDDASFDVAFTICVMHHVPPGDWPSFSRELARVVRPGGLAAVFEHNPWNPLTRRAVSNCPFDDDAVLLSRPRVEGLLNEAGLTTAERRYILFVPAGGKRTRQAEVLLRWLPVGAQHYVAASRT